MTSAGQFSEAFLEEIKARISVSALVGRSVKLTRRGHEWVGLSPFTSEKTPSFTVNDEKGFYHCFSSGEHGDIFAFLQKTKNLSFPEAVAQLAEEAGLELPARNAADAAKAARAALLQGVVEKACRLFEDALWSRAGEAALAYLYERGLTDATIKRFRLGYAPDGNVVKRTLMADGIGEYELLETRLLSPGKEGRESYDFFRDRVMFPIKDARGRVVAFGGRVMADDVQPKYLNSADTPLFQKGHLLYGLSLAREAATKAREIVTVEGYMDVIAMAQAGIENVVAPLGTALTEHQLALLWRLAPEPVMCFDGDKAGRGAMARAAARALPLLSAGVSLSFVALPEGQDPDDVCLNAGGDAMRALLAPDRRAALSAFVWDQLREAHPANTPERVAGLIEAAKAKAAEIKDDGVRAQYLNFFRGQLAEFIPQDLASTEEDDDGDDDHVKPTDILGTDCPFTALGHHKIEDTQCFDICDVMGQHRVLNERSFSATSIATIVFGDTKWLVAKAPADKGDRLPWRLADIQSLIMRACAAAGPFDPETTLRGPGVWPYGPLKEWPRQDESIVVNTGDRLVVWEHGENGWAEVPSKRKGAGRWVGDYFYVAAPGEDPIDGEALSDGEARRIVSHLSSFAWTDQEMIKDADGDLRVAALMLYGWFAAAFVPALLPFRPSGFLRAPTGYGKSTAQQLGEGLLGSTALSVKRASMTGIRKAFKRIGSNPARAVFIDEMEKKGEGAAEANRLQDILNLARYVWELDRSNQMMGDGGASGRINTILMMSGINPPRLEAEDANRMLLLGLEPHRADAKATQAFRDGQAASIALGPKFRRRMLERWPDYVPAYDAFHLRLVQSGQESRVCDAFATILAAAWIMLKPGLPSEDAVVDWTQQLTTSLLVGAIDETTPQHERCFTHLMTTRIEVGQGKPRIQIRDAVWRMWKHKDGQWWRYLLKAYGLEMVERVTRAEKRAAEAAKRDPIPRRMLAVPYELQALEDIYRPTEWKNGGWRHALAKLPGAEDNHPVTFLEKDDKRVLGVVNARRKAVLIPEDELFDGFDPRQVEGDDPYALDDNARAQAGA